MLYLYLYLINLFLGNAKVLEAMPRLRMTAVKQKNHKLQQKIFQHMIEAGGAAMVAWASAEGRGRGVETKWEIDGEYQPREAQEGEVAGAGEGAAGAHGARLLQEGGRGRETGQGEGEGEERSVPIGAAAPPPLPGGERPVQTGGCRPPMAEDGRVLTRQLTVPGFDCLYEY